jgi:hypothetical protein
VLKKNSKNSLANASVFLLSQPASLKNGSALLCGGGSGGFFYGCLGNPESCSGSGRNSIRGLNHFSRGGHEFVQSRARNNDRISPTMRFFGDTHKPAAFVFSEFYIEVLTLNL